MRALSVLLPAVALGAVTLFLQPPPPTPNDRATAEVAEVNARAAEMNARAGLWNTLAAGKFAATLNVNGIAVNIGTGGGAVTGSPGTVNDPKNGYTDAPIPPGTLFPLSDPWNAKVDAAAVDANSAGYIGQIAAGWSFGVHPDFGSFDGTAGPFGIPYNVVNKTCPHYQVTFSAAPAQSDKPAEGYPIPDNAWVENGAWAPNAGDHHLLVLDTDAKKVYELYQPRWDSGAKAWTADSGAVFDLTKTNPQRPAGWTSTDAAGLCVLAGLIRKDEVDVGAINHALRITVRQTFKGYVSPATHYASSTTTGPFLPMGARLRLKASKDISGLSGPARVVAQALKSYGAFVADNGSPMFATGTPDKNWDNGMMHDLQTKLNVNDFEVVQLGPVGTQPGP